MGKTINDFLGKHLLLGLTYRNSDGTVRETKQVHGIVVCDNCGGPALKIEGQSEPFRFPPAFDLFEAADPNVVYKLKLSREKVTGVDYIGTFEIK